MPSWTLKFSGRGKPVKLFREDAPDEVAPPGLLAHIAEIFGTSIRVGADPEPSENAAFITWPPADEPPANDTIAEE